MSETIAQKSICRDCGAEVREGSAFCYSCGHAIVPEPLPPPILKPSLQPVNGGNTENGTGKHYSEREPPPIMAPSAPLQLPTAGPGKPVTLAPERQRSRLRTRVVKTVEIEWVPRASSNVRFLVTAVLLAVIVGALVAVALYLR